MTESDLAADLVAKYGLADLLDSATDPAPIAQATEAVLNAIAEDTPALAILFRVEEAARFACAHHGVGFSRHRHRELLAQRLERTIAVIGGRLDTVEDHGRRGWPLVDAIEESVAAIDERVRADRDASSQVVATLFRAFAAAAADVCEDEHAVNARGEIHEVWSGATRAMILYALAQCRQAALAWYPQAGQRLGMAPARSGPFRTPAPRSADVEEEVEAARDEAVPPIVNERFAEALTFAAVLDAAGRSGGIHRGSPYRVRFGDPLHAQGILARRVRSAIAEARAAIVAQGASSAAVTCGALALEAAGKMVTLDVETLEANLRAIRGVLGDLSDEITKAWGIRGTPSSLVMRSLAVTRVGADQGMLDDVHAALAREKIEERNVSALSWCDRYYLASLCAKEAVDRPPLWQLFTSARVRARATEAEARWDAFRWFVEHKTGVGLPSARDCRRAYSLRRALDAHPVAAVYFSIPSLQELARGVVADRALGKAPRVVGAVACRFAAEAWVREAIAAFGLMRPAGQILERLVERAEFGTALAWPVVE